MIRIFLLVASLCSLGFVAKSQVRLPRLVSDGMVLQRNHDVHIWGWAAAAEKVTVSFNKASAAAVAGTDGKWSVNLPAMKEGGPYEMQINGTNSITLKDILIGDVWVCSGQSNMVLPMNRVKDRYPQEVATANNSFIRHFFIPTKYNFNGAQEDLPPGKWETATKENILRFTATGYFFAKMLYARYHVPIGLVNASVGGSAVESWMSEEGLKSFPSYIADLEKVKDTSFVKTVTRDDNAMQAAWYKALDQQDKGLHEKPRWSDPGYDVSSWPVMQVPGFWDDHGLKGVNGALWFRKEFNVPASLVGKQARLFLGTMIDRDSVFINGTFVGATGYQYPPRKYDLAPTILKEGKNIIAIRLINSSGKGGFTKDKPYQIFSGDQRIDLIGEWKYQIGAVSKPMRATTSFISKPCGLYNAMIAPVLQYPITGVIWYQGETNSSRAHDYQALFSKLIADWRSKWNMGSFPFLYAQLTNFMEAKPDPDESDWAELRFEQFKTLSVPGTAMAVTHDAGEWNDLHPTNKRDVGERLALAAQALAYGDKKIVYSGPVYQSMKINGNKISLTFSNTGSGLMAKGGGKLTYFAIAGADRKFEWAEAKIEKGKVIVWSDKVPKPVVVRYAWANNPEGANLYNKEGLPASPFQTENK